MNGTNLERNTEEGFKSGKMEAAMRATGSTTKLMARDVWYIKMVILTKEIGW